MTVQGAILIVLFAATLAAFGFIVRMLIRTLLLGRKQGGFGSPGKRIWSVIVYVAGQARVLAQPAGIGHFLIFWGFIFITLGTIEHITGMIVPGFSYVALFGATAAGWISLLQDILALLVLFAIIVSFYRRFIIKPVRLKIDDPGARNEAVFILSLIFVLILLMFCIKGIGIIDGKIDSRYAPVSAIAAKLFEGKGFDLHIAESILAWIHHLIIFFFLLYVPFSKHIHILGAIPNIYLRNLGSPGTLSRMDFEDETAEKFGNSELQDFTWKQLLDLYACTECGRCQAACPAFMTEKPLSPFRMIHRMRGLLMEDRGRLLKAAPERLEGMPIIPGTMTEDEIWACTTCGACMQECPPFIEHVQKIVDLRRYLVMTESRFPAEMQPVFKNMEVNYNPWTMGYSARADWAEGLDIPLASEKKEFDILFWVGCAGSFDSRGQSVSRAIASLLKKAKVDFAILGTEEMCCGETARRMGNEYLAQTLIEANIETLGKYSFNTILTACPHGLNTFRVEYPQFGYEKPVMHHSEFLLELVREGKLGAVKADFKKGVYHDSCYLGRYNDIIDEPRDLINSVVKTDLAEFGRHGKRSFCCGAGGGRMWMEEDTGKRINEERVDESLGLGVDRIFTACPFCLTMFEDGLKSRDVENIKVLDIAELVAGIDK
ncbi:MAG: 4Fe-4S dicluster domain-containing protein [Candidatus Krumholzibacteriota bacterium]|nr:4Fe-4S dicluster domain-containing protein [Candidatus Krumholzibacteriota bacterium]